MKGVTVFLLLSVYLFACSSNDQTSRIEVRLTDAPGDYDAVNIDIQGLQVHTQEGNPTTGWISLDVQKGVYDLLQLTNGIDTLLASSALPAGRISQIRLILGNNNSIVIDGQEIPITTPSSQQSGLKLNVQAELTEGITYKILLDFDAARSIIKRGNDAYNLKPVIRALSEATSGAIRGEVNPIASSPAVFAIMQDDTVATTYADESGKFLLRGVPAGTYIVGFNPKEGYEPMQKENITVIVDNVIDLGTVTIQ